MEENIRTYENDEFIKVKTCIEEKKHHQYKKK